MSDWRAGDKIEELLELLTLREHFAKLALNGLLSDSGVIGAPDKFAAASVKLADALIKELEKTTDG